MTALVTGSLFLVALIGGFARSFVGNEPNLKRAIYVLTFGPIAVVLGFLSHLTGALDSPRFLFLLAAMLCASYLPFFIGKRLGRPFVEIWQERRDIKLKETFK